MDVKVTAFQQRVYDGLMRIPRGKVTTYKLLADYLKCGSCQAVGQALKVNPFAPDIPCHRVVKSDLDIGGYQGKFGPRKAELLKAEGIKIESNKIVDISQIYSFCVPCSVNSVL